MAYIHSKGVVHADLGLHNFLLHDDGRLILCDFAGSGLDGLPPNVSAGVRYLNPLFEMDDASEKDDIFALGTVLYELNRGELLFNGKSDQEITQYLRNRQFPDLSLVSSPLRQVIEKCWRSPEDYKASNAVIELGKYITLSFGRTKLSIASQPSFIKALLPGFLRFADGAVSRLHLEITALKALVRESWEFVIAVALIFLLMLPFLVAVGFDLSHNHASGAS